MPKCDFNNVEIDPSNEANLKFFRKKQVVGAKFLAKLQASNCKKDHVLLSSWTHDINRTYARRSEDVQYVFGSYILSIYVLYPGG